MKKQKEIPIERKQDITASMIEHNILSKPEVRKKEPTSSFVIGVQDTFD